MSSADESPDVASAAVAGARWLTGSRLIAEVMILGSSVVLARLMSPADFGLAVLMRIVPQVAVILTFEGLGTRLVQRAEVDDRILGTARLLSLLAGVFGTVALVALALGPGPALLGADRAHLLALAAPAFVLVSFSVVSRAMIQRRLDFARIGIAELSNWSVVAVVSVALAVAGLNASAIVIGSVAGAFIESVVLCWRQREPRPTLDRGAASELLRFGVPASLAGLASVIYRNVEYVALSLRTSPSTVGLYWRASQVGAEYQGRVSLLVMRLAFPLASRTKDPEHLARLRVRGLRLLTLISFPPLALLILVAPIVVPFVYGPQWDAAAAPTQILAVSGMALTVVAMIDPILLGAGYPGRLLVSRIGVIVALGAAVAVTAPSGLLAVCVAVAGVRAIGAVLTERFLLNPVVPVPSGTILRAIAPATAVAAVIVATGLPAVDELERLGINRGVVFIVATAWAALCTVVVLRVGFRDAWSELRAMVARTLGRRRAPAAETAVAAGVAP